MVKSKKQSSQYTLIKGALLDVSPYVHEGIELEDIEECMTDILTKEKNCYAKPLTNLLVYHVQTNYDKDEDVKKLMDKLVFELDIMMAKEKYPEIIKKIN